MTGYILKVLNIYPTTTLNSHLWVYIKCSQFFTTGYIVITLGHHSKWGQFVISGHILVTVEVNIQNVPNF